MLIKDEETFLVVFRAFVEEFGPRLVTVTLPLSWQSLTDKNLGEVTVFWRTENLVRIEAGGSYHFQREVLT